MVTGSRSANFLDSSGTNPGGRVLLYLNCNNTFAAAGVPGNSIGSPEGRAARQDYEDKLAEAQAAGRGAAERAGRAAAVRVPLPAANAPHA